MHEPSKRRAGRILVAVAVAAGLIAVLPGVVIWRDGPDGGASRATQHPPDDAMAASGNQLWNRTWWSDGRANALWSDDAGNVYTCGYTESFGARESDMVLVKWNAEGNVSWYRTWGGSFSDDALGVWGDDAGNVFACGYTESSDGDDYNMALVKWDAAGNQLWNRTWGGSSSDYGCGVWGDRAGNVFTCGYTCSFGAGNLDMMLVKWDAAGNQLWNRTWGGADADLGYAVWCDDAGNVYTCGSTYSYCPGNYDMVLVKWDGSGQVLWFSILWGLPDDHASAVWGDGAGSIYVCGYSRFNTDYNDMVLAKWDVAGNLLWRQTWGEAASDDYAYAVWGDGAGNIYTCGEADDPYTGYCDMVLVQWDVAGNVLWNNTRGSTHLMGSGAWGDSAGNVYTCGSTWISDAGWGILLVKWMGSSFSQPQQQPQPQGVVMIVVFVVAAFITLAACMLAIIIRSCGLQAAGPARQSKSDRSDKRAVRSYWLHSMRRSGCIQ